MLVHLLALLLSLFSPFFQQANCLPYNLPDDAENPVFYYDASKVSPSDTVIQSCISHAISRINNGTCVSLMRSIGQQNVSIHFAFDSICGFDSSKSTIFLNRKCASDVDTCLQLVGRALTGKRKQTGAVLSHINGHFDCADHCSLECENGGKLVHGNYGSCSCQCPFNGLFTGETCSELVKLGEYTDTSCGTINATGDGGIIKLNGPLDGSTYCQFLLRSSDPWSKFQIQFIALNMSSKFVGSTECPDKLQVYGLDMSEALSPNFNLLAENSPSPAYSVKCAPGNAPKPGQLFSSIGNFLLFQLEGFRFDRTPRDGPIIRYTIRRPIFSDELHSASAGSSASQQGQGIVEDSIWTGRTEDGGPIGFLSNHLSLVALLVVMFGVSAIVIVLLAIRRHSGNKVKRNSSGHTPVPTSPTPNASV